MAGLLPTVKTFWDPIPTMRFPMCCFLRAFSPTVFCTAANLQLFSQAALSSRLHVLNISLRQRNSFPFPFLKVSFF